MRATTTALYYTPPLAKRLPMVFAPSEVPWGVQARVKEGRAACRGGAFVHPPVFVLLRLRCNGHIDRFHDTVQAMPAGQEFKLCFHQRVQTNVDAIDTGRPAVGCSVIATTKMQKKRHRCPNRQRLRVRDCLVTVTKKTTH